MDSLPTRLSDYQVICELGRGSFGVVYKVQTRSSPATLVLKRVNSNLMTGQTADTIREVQLLKMIRHPHIIRYYTSFVEEGSVCIVMEFAEGGDLQRLLRDHKERNKHFSERKVWRFAFELASALSHLHTHHIIHRDVKCLNVLLTKDHHVKLGDLGASKIALQSALHLTRVGTPLYLAPELVKQQAYDCKVDVWALGCVLYLLTSFEAPFQGENLLALGSAIVSKQPKPIPAIYSPRLWTYIQRLLTKQPAQRPTISEALDMIPAEEKAALEVLPGLEELSTNFTLAGKEETQGGGKTQALRKVRIPDHLKELIRKLENPVMRSTAVSPRALHPGNSVERAISPSQPREVRAPALSPRPIKSPESLLHSDETARSVLKSAHIPPKATPSKPTIAKLHAPQDSQSLKPAERDPRVSSVVIEAKEPLILVRGGRTQVSEEERAALIRIFAPTRPKTAGHRVQLAIDQPDSKPLPHSTSAINAILRPATARLKSDRSNPLFRPAKLAALLRPCTWTLAASSHPANCKKRLSVKDLY